MFLKAESPHGKECGLESPHSVRPESPATHGGRASPRAVRAESPVGISAFSETVCPVPQGQHFINRRLQPTVGKHSRKVPQGRHFIRKVPSLRDSSCEKLRYRRLKPTVNKVLSHAGLFGCVFGILRVYYFEKCSYVGFCPTLMPAALSGLKKRHLFSEGAQTV